MSSTVGGSQSRVTDVCFCTLVVQFTHLIPTTTLSLSFFVFLRYTSNLFFSHRLTDEQHRSTEERTPRPEILSCHPQIAKHKYPPTHTREVNSNILLHFYSKKKLVFYPFICSHVLLSRKVLDPQKTLTKGVERYSTLRLALDIHFALLSPVLLCFITFFLSVSVIFFPCHLEACVHKHTKIENVTTHTLTDLIQRTRGGRRIHAAFFFSVISLN